jgi:hypothetical protein
MAYNQYVMFNSLEILKSSMAIKYIQKPIMIQKTILKLELIVITSKILDLILILQLAFDANNKGIFFQIFTNLTKKDFVIMSYQQ